MPLKHPRIQKRRLEEAAALAVAKALMGYDEVLTHALPDWDDGGTYFEVRIIRRP